MTTPTPTTPGAMPMERRWPTGAVVAVCLLSAALLITLGALAVVAANAALGPKQSYEVDVKDAVAGDTYTFTSNLAGIVKTATQTGPLTLNQAELSPGQTLVVTVDGAGSALAQCVVYRVDNGQRRQVFSDVQDVDFTGDGSRSPATCYVTEPLQ